MSKLSDYKLPLKTPESNFDSQPKKKIVYSLQDLKEDIPVTTKTNEGGAKPNYGGKNVGLTVKPDKHTRIG